MADPPTDFVHPDHLRFFVEAAQKFQCHILVRKTGKDSLKWVGKAGYIGKLMDMKAKTSNRDAPRYQTAGLVCSPEVQPEAFTPDRLAKARKEWAHGSALITVPPNKAGFADGQPVRNCQTPYILQNNPASRHYGCVALVRKGNRQPLYVHGDYDLYDIMPAAHAMFPTLAMMHRSQSVPGAARAAWAMPQTRRGITSEESPLVGWVENYINSCITGISAAGAGAHMVNHGEQVNLGAPGVTFEPVLAFTYRARNGEPYRILATPQDHAALYREIGIPA